jgi:hypothetical protein
MSCTSAACAAIRCARCTERARWTAAGEAHSDADSESPADDGPATAYTISKPTTNDNTNKNNSPRHPRATRTAGASHSTPLHTISRAQCTDRTCYRPRQHSRTLAGRRVDTAEHQRPLRRRSGPPKPCDEPTHQWERPQRIRRKEGTNHLRRVDSRGDDFTRYNDRIVGGPARGIQDSEIREGELALHISNTHEELTSAFKKASKSEKGGKV